MKNNNTFVILRLNKEFINKRLLVLDGFTKPLDEIIYDAIDFYLFERPTDREYIKIEKILEFNE